MAPTAPRGTKQRSYRGLAEQSKRLALLGLGQSGQADHSMRALYGRENEGANSQRPVVSSGFSNNSGLRGGARH